MEVSLEARSKGGGCGGVFSFLKALVGPGCQATAEGARVRQEAAIAKLLNPKLINSPSSVFSFFMRLVEALRVALEG